jgi:hypothetical protein
MADNVTVDNGTGTDYGVAGDKVTYSGDADQTVQLVKVVQTTGAEGSKTVVDPAHDDADDGNPVKIGGRADTGTPAGVADGDRVNAWFTPNGALVTRIGTVEQWLLDADAVDNTAVPVLSVAGFGYVFNGSTHDRLRGDTLGVHVSRQATAATATLSNVASSATSVTLLSANTSRKGCTIANDSTQILYVKFGTTASTTSYTVKMIADAYYEVPFGYTGRIDGIWASANGNARLTEMT